MNGYQSDLTLGSIKNGNVPVGCLLGGFAVAQSGFGSDYSMSLDPPIVQYEVGVMYRVHFQATNFGGQTTLNIDGLGAKPLKVVVGQLLVDIHPVAGINENQIYLLIDRGPHFEVINPPVNPRALKYLEANFSTHALGAGTGDQVLGTVAFSPNVFTQHLIIEIKVSGEILVGEAKTIKLTLFDIPIFEHTTLNAGNYELNLVVGKSGNFLSSRGAFSIDGFPMVFTRVQEPGVDFSAFTLLQFIGQANNQPNGLSKDMFIVKGTSNN